MSLKQQIDSDIKAAMLAKNKDELTALRAIKSMILLAETDKSSTGELNVEVESKLLMKAAKQRKESADIFQKEGRQDLAKTELLELDVISRYLPKQLSNDELLLEVKKIIEQVGAKGPQDMGKVMGTATKQLAGKADGKLISEMVKKILTP
ncbi:MAG: GatB/YqeY domain-containing protein [Bacteroidia bacterium]|nr:GatB/YqeY domain-containing protein [Bacteroidia bacterium]